MKYGADLFEPLHADLFGPLHASYYDHFHRDKDYVAEVGQLGEVFAEEGPVGSIVDFGCGTGRHLELLAEAGHDVIGVDRSAAMLERARKRLAHFGSRADVVQADLFDVELDRTFDAAIMMFSLLGYHVTNERILAALAAMSRQVRPGGLLAFDIMDAAAILRDDPPGGGVAKIALDDQKLLCAYSTTVNTIEQVIELKLRMWQLDDDRVVDHVDETHLIRYFLPRELGTLLSTGGFELIDSAPLAGHGGDPALAWLRLVWVRKT